MSFLSINVRGVGEDAKVGWVKRLKINHKATFVGLQETQISDSSNIDVNGCWGSILIMLVLIPAGDQLDSSLFGTPLASKI